MVTPPIMGVRFRDMRSPHRLPIKSVERTNPVPVVLEGLRKAGLKDE